MKLSEKQFIFTRNVAKLIEYIFESGYYCTLGEAYRSKEQAAIYEKLKKGTANSLHCDRLAIDLNLFSPEGEYLTATEEYQKFGTYWKNLNPANRWGGDFLQRKDGNHFSLTDDGVRA